MIGVVAYVGLMRTSYGAILRGAGGNPVAVERAGWSMLTVKMVLFGLAGLCGVLAGMALIGLTTSADANLGNGYTLLSIAGAILGGGEFAGGRVSPIGAVIGATDADARGLAAQLPAHLARLAGRRAGRHPDRRARRPGADQPDRGRA